MVKKIVVFFTKYTFITFKKLTLLFLNILELEIKLWMVLLLFWYTPLMSLRDINLYSFASSKIILEKSDPNQLGIKTKKRTS